MKIALVHDYLTQFGGAERVLEAFHEIWPDAPIFTSLYDPAALPTHWRSWDIRESVLSRIPGARHHHRALLPLYPLAFAAFQRQLADYEIVLSDTSAWAHQAGTNRQVRITYCHSPSRFLWGDEAYLTPARIPVPVRGVMDLGFGGLRWLDHRAAGELDVVVANSRAVAGRIEHVWGRAASVVYPPIQIDRFTPAEPAGIEPFALVVSRLVPHKRIELVIDACTATGRPLKVVGGGPAEERLRRRAGPSVEFLGQCSDGETADLMSRCQVFVLPGQEDFGITAVEAQAAGRPVVAYRGGGAVESVIEGQTGLFFDEPTGSSLSAALELADRTAWSAVACRTNAIRFGTPRFKEAISDIVDAAWRDRSSGDPLWSTGRYSNLRRQRSERRDWHRERM